MARVPQPALPQDPVPQLPQDPVACHIFVPREVAFNLDKMKQVTEKVLGRLGCGGCHSGRILIFHTLQNFVVNARTLDVEEIMPTGVPG
jgi:hypothetical protein